MDSKIISITYAQSYDSDGVIMRSKILQVNINDFDTVIRTLRAIQETIGDDYFYFITCDNESIYKI